MDPLRFKRLTKLIVSLAYYAFLTISGFGKRVAGSPSQQQLTILYYHGIPANCRSHFASQMEMLSRWVRVVPASYCADGQSDRKPVAITFDDAFVSVLENALPELAARSFCSTIFVPVGLLGRLPDWLRESNFSDHAEIVMSSEQLNGLHADLVSIGSHSIRHPHLSQLDRESARKEIEGSRYQLQNLTGREIRLFAFPYGDHNPATVELCRAAGYDYVFTIIPTPTNPSRFNIVRGRVKVDPSDSHLEFFLKFKGAYAWMSYLSLLKHKLRSALFSSHGGAL